MFITDMIWFYFSGEVFIVIVRILRTVFDSNCCENEQMSIKLTYTIVIKCGENLVLLTISSNLPLHALSELRQFYFIIAT